MRRPLARAPKSLGVATMPRPKWCCQSRLTITRAVSGWSGRVSHARQRRPAAGRARRRQRPAAAALAGSMTETKRRRDLGSRARESPRRRTCVGGATGRRRSRQRHRQRRRRFGVERARASSASSSRCPSPRRRARASPARPTGPGRMRHASWRAAAARRASALGRARRTACVSGANLRAPHPSRAVLAVTASRSSRSARHRGSAAPMRP